MIIWASGGPIRSHGSDRQVLKLNEERLSPSFVVLVDCPAAKQIHKRLLTIIKFIKIIYAFYASHARRHGLERTLKIRHSFLSLVSGLWLEVGPWCTYIHVLRSRYY